VFLIGLERQWYGNDYKEMTTMEKKLVKSQYGVWIDVYEIEHEGRILWFRDYEIEAAAKRRDTSRQVDKMALVRIRL
jgi:hypothetical protein